MLRPGGETRFCLAYGHLDADANGHAVRLYGSCQDITERKQAEEALRESELSFRLTTENLSELVYRADPRTLRASYVNKAVSRFFGYTPQEWLANPDLWVQCIHPDDKKRVLAAFATAIRESRPLDVAYRIIDRSGAVRWVEDKATVATDEAGQSASLYSVVTDITEQKLAMDSLAEQQALLRDILDGVRAACFIIDADSMTIVQVNPRAATLVGVSSEELMGRRCQDILNAKNICETCMRCQQGTPIILKQRTSLRTAQDKRVAVELSIIPVTFRGKNHRVVVIFDVTEQENVEQQLAYAQKLESIGQLAAGLAHEINTPIQYVVGNVTYLKESLEKLAWYIRLCDEFLGQRSSLSEADLSDRLAATRKKAGIDFLLRETPEAIRDTLHGLERVSSIVQAMKKFSHPGPEEKTLVRVAEAIENTITVARNEWKYASEMVTDFDEALPTLLCKAGDFNQAILNLLVNAAQANAQAVGDSETKGRITIQTRRRDDWAEIRVSDTGPGIPENIRNRVFDPFFTTKEVGMGTGQGLSIVHAIMNKHGGSVDFETEIGKGATFILRFPLGEPGEA